MPTCQEVSRHLLESSVDGHDLLSGVRVRAHLTRCPHCRAHRDQLRLTARALERLPTTAVRAETKDAVLARFRAAHPRRSARPPFVLRLLAALDGFGGRRRGGWLSLALFGAAALLLVLTTEATGAPGQGLPCMLVEMAAGAVALGGVLWLAHTRGSSISAGAWTVPATIGALGGLVLNQLVCPASHVMSHALIFHASALLLAAGAGRVAAWASRARRA